MPDQKMIKSPIRTQHYHELPANMCMECLPDEALAPDLVELNQELLNTWHVSSSWFRSPQALDVLSGRGSLEELSPIAMAYSGHQFGQWSPILGDGRAHMLGQIATADNTFVDIQLKGSGRTPFSRGGDGRATLGSVLREYVVSEAMAGLGIPTTRSLAIVTTGEFVRREHAYPGAILVRSATSHLRVGSFQYAHASSGEEGVQALADFILRHHFPHLEFEPGKYAKLLTAIAERQAILIAQWMQVGFIHGVMNTDNVSLVGETIDYGPCAFMDEFQADKVFSSIDVNGRYAWDKQPGIGYWNLTQLAQTLLPLLDAKPDEAKAIAEQSLHSYASVFHETFESAMCGKLGLQATDVGAPQFVSNTLGLLASQAVDYTLFFDKLTAIAAGADEDRFYTLFSNKQPAVDWLQSWRSLVGTTLDIADVMRALNPAVIARNHRVEEAISAAVDHQDYQPFRRLVRVLATPYELAEADSELSKAPHTEERVTQTFCGT